MIKKYVKDGNSMSRFFPICENIYLHKDLLDGSYPISHLSYPNVYLLEYKDGRLGIRIECENYRTNIIGISITFGAIMPEEWEKLGLNWHLSFKDIWMLMKKNGFENIISISPHVTYIGGEKIFEAEFFSFANDSSFGVKFKFGYRKGNSILDNNTLYQIDIQSYNNGRSN